MTAVRLRGNDHIARALEVYQRHLDGELIKDLATEYGAHPDVVGRWIKTGKKHALPDLTDKQAWFRLIVQDQGSRLEDAKDTDSVAIAKLLSQLLGVGSVEELRLHMAQLETAKVALVAKAFDQTIADLPNRKALRAAFLDAIEANEPALTA